MIVSKNISPERDLYYLGSILIDIFQSKNIKEIDYIELYSSFKEKSDIGANLFLLTLDWLFILGLIKNSDNGKIKRCF